MALAPPLVSLGPRRYIGAYAAHAHDHAQVLIGQRGRLELEVEGHAAFVDASCGVIIPAGASHAYDAAAPAEVLVLDHSPQAGLERCRRFVAPPRWRNAPPDSASAIEALLEAPRVLQRRAIPVERLEAAVAAALHEDWSTHRLAALCGFSPQRFHARFVELTDRTPADWVRERRLDAAERHLRAGRSLETTALQVGYATASALAAALRRERGAGARALRGQR